MVELVEVARIFSARARVLIVEELLSGPKTAGNLAEKLALQPITIHHHLRVLAGAGIVEEIEGQKSGKSGRPWSQYRLRPQSVSLNFPPRAYQALAEMLMGVLVGSMSPGETRRKARTLGRTVGLQVAEHLKGLAGLTRWRLSDVRHWFIDVHERQMGFAPQVVEARRSKLRWEVHNCVVLEVAKKHPEFICEMDAPIVEGVLEGLGVEGQVCRRQCMGHGAPHCEFEITT